MEMKLKHLFTVAAGHRIEALTIRHIKIKNLKAAGRKESFSRANTCQ